MIVNITGKIPDDGEILLQSINTLGMFKESIALYFARSMKAAEKLDVKTLQGIFNAKANTIDELKALNFEHNQRIGELLVLLSIVMSLNQYHKNIGSDHGDFVPAWQKPKQGPSMNSFTDKESWDGFMYEYVPLGTENPSIDVKMIPLEIKSLGIRPEDEKFVNLNELLEQRMPKYRKYFQLAGSVGALLVLPYAFDQNASSIPFNLKDATAIINGNVSFETISSLVFLSIDKQDDGTTLISTRCHFVNKNPAFGDNGNIDNVDMFELRLCKY